MIDLMLFSIVVIFIKQIYNHLQDITMSTTDLITRYFHKCEQIEQKIRPIESALHNFCQSRNKVNGRLANVGCYSNEIFYLKSAVIIYIYIISDAQQFSIVSGLRMILLVEHILTKCNAHRGINECNGGSMRQNQFPTEEQTECV